MKRALWIVAATAVLISTAGSAWAAEIGFVETYVLAKDKSEAIKQLIPGTDQYYYYQCLRYQAMGQYDEVEAVVAKWLDRRKGSVCEEIVEIQNRQALLGFKANPDKTLEYLKNKLALHFNHQRQIAVKSTLPTKLDPALISRKTLTARALARSNGELLGGFEASAMQWLDPSRMSARGLRAYLQRLARPDHAGIIELVAKDLAEKNSGGFGSLQIHGRLLLDQLDALVKLRPELKRSSNFVYAYLARLRPGEDVDWRQDPAAELKYVQRMWSYVSGLDPAFNSLKANVLYHWLSLDRKRGVYDKGRFMEYIKLPRRVGYIPLPVLRTREYQLHAANLGQSFQSQTLLPPVGTDEPLVREYLEHFFVKETSYEPYAEFIRDTYLKSVFAETKLLAGVGDPEKWTAMLSPSEYKALTERVELNFAPTNPKYFAPQEKVKLAVDVKHVKKLIVKVYRVNELKYYQQVGRAVPLSLDLDGLVANEQESRTYDEPPLRRVRRTFEFPQLKDRGVYVIELIGSGKRSRVLVQKGRLSYAVRTTPAGQEFTVLDEANKLVPDARIWMGGTYYDADKDGTILLPFSTQPRNQNIVLVRGDFATLTSFSHLSESYSLTCGFFVDREALLPGREATLMVRPQLRLAGQPVSLKLLKDVELSIQSVDIDGVASTRREPKFKLFEDRESTFTFRVPQRLRSLRFVLTAKVKNISQDKEQNLAAAQNFAVDGTSTLADNGARQAVSMSPDSLYLLQADGKYFLEARGRNGETLADRPVRLSLKHRDFKQQVHVSLKTDQAGRVTLGELDGIETIFARDERLESIRGAIQIWHPAVDAHDLPVELQGKVGQTLRVAYMGQAGKPDREELSLLEVRDGQYVADWFKALSIRDGMIVIDDLPAGDYSLWLKYPGGRTITIRIAEGPVVGGYVCSAARRLELSRDKPVQIASVSADRDELTVKLTNASDLTRVHVIAARYMPDYDAMSMLAPFGQLGLAVGSVSKPVSFYEAGRKISDEYRYILDRQSAKKWPGNMLKRPSLILNPWSTRTADTGVAMGAEGENLGSMAGTAGGGPRSRFYGTAGGVRSSQLAWRGTLEFLADGAVVLTNLVPEKDGTVKIPRKLLDGKQQIRILAVDTEHTALRQLSLDEVAPKLRDCTLSKKTALDPDKHCIQQKVVTPVPAGGEFTIRDVASTRFEIFDSLPRAYHLMVTLNADATLQEFSFLKDWPTLTDAEKLEKYARYACHELHLFLYERDRAFFDKVVLPYLKNKKDKTFMDKFLCGEDLSEFMTPWRYAQLNVVEQAMLAQRIAGERKRTARAIKDRFELIPPDMDRFNRIFDTALGLAALAPAEKPAHGKTERYFEAGDKASAAKLQELAAKVVRSRSTTESRRGGIARNAPASMAAPVIAGRRMTVKRKSGSRRESEKKLDSADGILALQAGAARYKYDAAKLADAKAHMLYRRVGQVKEWAENNYYHLLNAQANASLISVNAFWRDYAAWSGEDGFLSGNFAEASHNFHEILCALAVLDLPFKAKDHETSIDGQSMTIKPSGNMVVFHEEITEVQAPKTQPILVSQNYYRYGQRYKHVNGEQVDNFVSDEFLAGEAYGCNVVVTNPTSAKRKLQVLVQVPQGSIPLAGGKYTHAFYVELQPYRTQTFDYYFYFPQSGEHGQFGVHVATGGKLVGFAPGRTLNVVAELTKVDKTSWDYVSQYGTDDEVLGFLKANNLGRITLSKIAWRMKDRQMFDAVLGLLTARHAFDATLWSYSIKHGEAGRIAQYLACRGDFISKCGDWLVSDLLTIDPVVRKAYQHLEYWPMVNARAHLFGAKRKILVPELYRQYTHLLNILRYKRDLDDQDRMDLTYYLLVQDRVADGLEMFRQVDAGKLPERIQHDYFTAYLDFYKSEPAEARKIAAGYEKYPVKRWRELFAAVVAQADEITGKAPAVVSDKDRQEKQTALASAEPTFEFKVEARKIELTSQNIKSVRVNYYLMDIEQMFSSQPFVSDRGGQFAYIQPNVTQKADVPAAGKTTVAMPAELANRNVIVEVVAGGKTQTQAYYSNSLTVAVMSNYGQLRVTDTDAKPLAKVYVKVYARMRNGTVEFYKDGYTDLRGRFDYSSLNTNQLGAVDKFAILVLSEKNGSTVREAEPPKE